MHKLQLLENELNSFLGNLDNKTAIQLLNLIKENSLTQVASFVKQLPQNIHNTFVQILQETFNESRTGSINDDENLELMKALFYSSLDSRIVMLASNERPSYPQKWLRYEIKNKINDTPDLQPKIDHYRQLQLNKSNSLLSFYRDIYNNVLSDSLKVAFKKYFKFVATWLDVEVKLQLNELQINLLDSCIPNIDEVTEFNLLRCAHNFLGLTSDQIHIIENSFALEVKWIRFEEEAVNLSPFTPAQYDEINKIYRSALKGATVSVTLFLTGLEKSVTCLTPEQKQLLATHFSKTDYSFFEISPHNTAQVSRHQRGKRPAKEKQAPIEKTKKIKTASKKVKSDNSFAGEEINDAIDDYIGKAVAIFYQKLNNQSVTTRRLQATQLLDGKKYLTQIIEIAPDAHLSNQEKENFGKQVVKRITRKLPHSSLKNIILVSENKEWTKNNIYNDSSGNMIGFTIPENAIIGTVAIRGWTADNIAKTFSSKKTASLVAPSLSNFLNTTQETVARNVTSPFDTSMNVTEDESAAEALQLLQSPEKTKSEILMHSPSTDTMTPIQSETREEIIAQIHSLQKSIKKLKEERLEANSKRSLT